MKTRRMNNRGVTLVELIVAMAVAGVVIAAAYMILTSGIRTYNASLKSAAGQQNLRAAMMKISRDVRNAKSMPTVSGGVLTVDGNSYEASSGELKHGGTVYAVNISSVTASYTDASKTVVQIELRSADGITLSTQIRIQDS